MLARPTSIPSFAELELILPSPCMASCQCWIHRWPFSWQGGIGTNPHWIDLDSDWSNGPPSIRNVSKQAGRGLCEDGPRRWTLIAAVQNGRHTIVGDGPAGSALYPPNMAHGDCCRTRIDEPDPRARSSVRTVGSCRTLMLEKYDPSCSLMLDDSRSPAGDLAQGWACEQMTIRGVLESDVPMDCVAHQVVLITAKQWKESIIHIRLELHHSANNNGSPPPSASGVQSRGWGAFIRGSPMRGAICLLPTACEKARGLSRRRQNLRSPGRPPPLFLPLSFWYDQGRLLLGSDRQRSSRQTEKKPGRPSAAEASAASDSIAGAAGRGSCRSISTCRGGKCSWWPTRSSSPIRRRTTSCTYLVMAIIVVVVVVVVRSVCLSDRCWDHADGIDPQGSTLGPSRSSQTGVCLLDVEAVLSRHVVSSSCPSLRSVRVILLISMGSVDPGPADEPCSLVDSTAQRLSISLVPPRASLVQLVSAFLLGHQSISAPAIIIRSGLQSLAVVVLRHPSATSARLGTDHCLTHVQQSGVPPSPGAHLHPRTEESRGNAGPGETRKRMGRLLRRTMGKGGIAGRVLAKGSIVRIRRRREGKYCSPPSDPLSLPPSLHPSIQLPSKRTCGLQQQHHLLSVHTDRRETFHACWVKPKPGLLMKVLADADRCAGSQKWMW